MVDDALVSSLASVMTTSSSSSTVSENHTNHATWDMFTGADAWLIKYGCPSCQQFEGPPSLWSTLNEHPPRPPPPSPLPVSPTPPLTTNQNAPPRLPSKTCTSARDALIHKENCSIDPSTNEETCAVEVKVPVLGFCAMKAAINRLNKNRKCGHYGPEESTVGTSTPSPRR